MARGRKPIPPEVARLRGDAGKRHPAKTRRRAAKGGADATPAPAPPSAPRTAWDPPLHLGPPVAAVWRRELPQLREAGLLKPSDLVAFEVYCAAKHRWEAACAVVAAKGMTYTSESKHGAMERERPEMKIIASAERAIRGFLEGLAGTTTSRLRAAAQLALRQPSLPLAMPGEALPATAGTGAPSSPAAAGATDDPVGYLN